MAGQQDDNGGFTGSCKGDSGGPLKTQFVDSKRDTLIGIVSGGVGCGNGIPGWYTKVCITTFLCKGCLQKKKIAYNETFAYSPLTPTLPTLYRTKKNVT